MIKIDWVKFFASKPRLGFYRHYGNALKIKWSWHFMFNKDPIIIYGIKRR